MDEEVTTIHITKALSSSMIVYLMDEYPNLQEITCAPSVYGRTSSKYIEALKTLDIEVKIKYNWGAKSRSNNIEIYIAKLSDDEGLSAKQISQKLDIPLSRVYYLLKKSKTNITNRKRKYDYSKIKQLKKEGYSVKEISEMLGMPLRSVYYILNNNSEIELESINNAFNMNESRIKKEIKDIGKSKDPKSDRSQQFVEMIKK